MVLGRISDPTRECFADLKRRDLHYVEYCVDIGKDPKTLIYDRIDELKGLMQEYDVKIGAMGRWGTSKFDENGQLIEEEFQNNIMLVDACAALGCPVFNTGVNYNGNFSYYTNCTLAISYLEKMIAHGKEKGVQINVYNCDWNNFVHSDKAWSIILDHLPDLGIKYDASHAMGRGADCMVDTEKWGHRFKHVHVKGVLRVPGTGVVDAPPAGMDSINWGAYIALLHAKGYDGMLSIEPHSENWSGEIGERGLDYTIQYMKQFIY